MMSMRRSCFSVSGPGTPSRRRSAAPRIDVSGDRSSCETVSKKSRFISSIRRSWLAIELNDRASAPISSRLSTAMGSRNAPAATSAVVEDRRASERVIRWATRAVPSRARQTAAPSATRTAVHVRASSRAASAWAEDPRVGRRHQRVEALLDLLGEHPPVGVDQTQGLPALAALEERPFLGDDAPVPLERHARLTEVQRLPLAHRVLGEAPEILGDLSRP